MYLVYTRVQGRIHKNSLLLSPSSSNQEKHVVIIIFKRFYQHHINPLNILLNIYYWSVDNCKQMLTSDLSPTMFTVNMDPGSCRRTRRYLPSDMISSQTHFILVAVFTRDLEGAVLCLYTENQHVQFYDYRLHMKTKLNTYEEYYWE